ncbi:hypothetical protein ACLB2K_068783 [Fragaria x ananassa]
MNQIRPAVESYRNSMEATVAPNAIVLNKNNYQEWSVWVRTYLVAHDLWDIVENGIDPKSSQNESKYLRKKNAQALHAIQISCGLAAFSLIKNVTSAGVALLTANQQQELSRSQGFLYDTGFEFDPNTFHKCVPFIEDVKQGHWEAAYKLYKKNPDTIRARIPIDAGRPHIVEQLVHLMPQEYLEIRGNDGMTALAAAASKGLTRMAKCMVSKNKRILSIGDECFK